MALNEPTPHNEVVVGPIAPASTGATSTAPLYFVAGVRGRLVRAYSQIVASGATTEWTWTMTHNDTAITGTGTIAASGSAGDVDEVIFTNGPVVNHNDKVAIINTGEATSSTRLTRWYAVFRT